MYNPHVALLSETHIAHKDRNLLNQLGYDLVISSSLNTSTRGVAILKHKQFRVLVIKTDTDHQGRWAIAQLEIEKANYTFCVI